MNKSTYINMFSVLITFMILDTKTFEFQITSLVIKEI